MTSFDAERFDVEASLPVELTLQERRHARARSVRRNAPLFAATVLLVVGCAVLALVASRALVRTAYGPSGGHSTPHVVPFIVNIDR